MGSRGEAKMDVDSRIERLRQEVEALKSRATALEGFRVKDNEHSEAVTELLEMVAEDVSRLKKQNREYEQAFDLASKEIDEIKDKVQQLGFEQSEQPIVTPDVGGIPEQPEEKDALVESLTEKAVDVCTQERPEIIAPEMLGGAASDPRNVFPRDWDVAMIVREYQRRAVNVHPD
jgi:chromosome segregation ATPase